VRALSSPILGQYHRGALRFTLPIQVTSADIDELGHVSNQVYLRWVLDIAMAHSSHVGWNHAQYRELGGIFVVRRHELDYLAQVRLGDEVRAETWVPSWKLASCIRATEVFLGDRVVLRAQTTWAFMALATARPTKIPDELRALFS
jgi:acyl-CoA thioester hydrolase